MSSSSEDPQRKMLLSSLNMMSTKCSSHFIEAYGDYKRALWRSQEEERLKQLKVNGRFVMPSYEEDDDERGYSRQDVSRSIGSIYDQTPRNSKCPQMDTFIEERNEDENKEDKCVWQDELQQKRQSIYTASLSASNLERLQLLAARRNTLPENVFSKLRDKCSQIQSRRVLPTVADEEDEEEEEETNASSDEYFAEEEANLPEETRLLIRRSRQLSASMQNKPRTRQTKFEEILSTPFNEGTSEKVSFPNISSKNKRNEYSRHMTERRRDRGGITKTPLTKTVSNERNIIDINESSPSGESPPRRVTYTANILPSQIKRNGSIASQTDTSNHVTTCTKTCSNQIPSTDVNTSLPRRYPKLFANGTQHVKTLQHREEKKVNVRINELKGCRYLRQEVLSNSCTCNTCERRKTICNNCKGGKEIDF